MRERPANAILISERRPPRDQEVLGWIEDPEVAIHDLPVIVWDTGTNEHPLYFTGVPGRYTALEDYRWTLTHWLPLPT